MGNPRVHRLVEEICSMNLLEIADLTELLRKKLGISASPGMYAMGKMHTHTHIHTPLQCALCFCIYLCHLISSISLCTSFWQP